MISSTFISSSASLFVFPADISEEGDAFNAALSGRRPTIRRAGRHRRHKAPLRRAMAPVAHVVYCTGTRSPYNFRMGPAQGGARHKRVIDMTD